MKRSDAGERKRRKKVLWAIEKEDRGERRATLFSRSLCKEYASTTLLPSLQKIQTV